jgi:hypothetical protein
LATQDFVGANAGGGSLFNTTVTAVTNYTASPNEIICLTASGINLDMRINLPAVANDGDLIFLVSPSDNDNYSESNLGKINIYSNGGTLLRSLQLQPFAGPIILTYDGTEWIIPVTSPKVLRNTSGAEDLYPHEFGKAIIYGDDGANTPLTVNLQRSASSLVEGTTQRILCRGKRDIILNSPSADIVSPKDGVYPASPVNTVTFTAHGGFVEILVNSLDQYVVSAPVANLSDVAFSGSYSDLSSVPNALSSLDIDGDGDLTFSTAKLATQDYVAENAGGSGGGELFIEVTTSGFYQKLITTQEYLDNDVIYLYRAGTCDIQVVLPAVASSLHGKELKIVNLTQGNNFF